MILLRYGYSIRANRAFLHGAVTTKKTDRRLLVNQLRNQRIGRAIYRVRLGPLVLATSLAQRCARI